MLKIMRPKNIIHIKYMEEGIYIARIWHDISWLYYEVMTALIIGENNRLLEYNVLATGNESNVTFDYKEIVERGECLGAKYIYLLHNHPGRQYTKLSGKDIDIIINPGKEYEKYKVKVNKIACLSWKLGGEIYSKESGLTFYNENIMHNIANFYKLQGLGYHNLKKECIVIADSFNYLKYNTESKMKAAQERVMKVAEKTKYDPEMNTVTRWDKIISRKKHIYYGYETVKY